jgi:hypothetical protein
MPRRRRPDRLGVPTPDRRCRRFVALAVVVAASLTVTACQSPGLQPAQLRVWQTERFEMSEAFSRTFDAPAAQTCEAARRALLSQGYLLADASARPGSLQARKHFQPDGEVHVQIEFTVHCMAEGPISTAFATAIQEQYVLRRSTTSASVGVSAIGSVSIPVGSAGDSLVKVGSMTIPGGEFYDRFFGLMDRFLREQPVDPVADVAPATTTP